MGSVRGLGVACLAGVTACTTSANITRLNGTSVEGWIRGGTVDTVIIDPRVGQRQEIPRSEIADVDHPGNVHVIVGGIVLSYGAVLAATNFADCKDNSGPASDCAVLFLPALAGAGLLAWGLSTWLGSKDAAEDRSLAHRPKQRQRPETPPPEPSGVNDAPPPPDVLPPLGPRSPAPAPSGSVAPPVEAPEAPAPPPAPPEPAPESPPGVTW